jgi:hypothetical protein
MQLELCWVSLVWEQAGGGWHGHADWYYLLSLYKVPGGLLCTCQNKSNILFVLQAVTGIITDVRSSHCHNFTRELLLVGSFL